MTFRSSGRLSIRRMHDGVYTEIGYVNVPANFQPGRSYRMRFESVGDQHVVFMDGFPMLHVKDTALTRGHPGVAEDQRVQRPQPGREHAEADQRVHRRGAVAEVGPRGAVERRPAPDDDRRGQGQRQPLPERELPCWNHGQRDHRRGAGGGPAGTAAADR